MDKLFKLPPKSAADLTPPVQLSLNLSGLIGQEFHVTGKPRTDGSNVRKRIAQTLQSFQLPEAADINSYVIVPPKGKGVPRNVREFVDSYIVTTGDSYNLQVWNRIPDSESLLIDYESSSPLKCSDVRFVFVKINIEESLIESVIILTADYIVSHFGKFGKQTVKHQLLISPKARKAIYELGDRILTFPDSAKLKYLVKDEFTPPASDIAQEPDLNNLYSINQLKERI
ncbi:MAG: hypothetical protein PHF53_08765, partial [Bacteroidales bacterium]|nr:hypothetical protein [Bacteroidales bacterium]